MSLVVPAQHSALRGEQAGEVTQELEADPHLSNGAPDGPTVALSNGGGARGDISDTTNDVGNSVSNGATKGWSGSAVKEPSNGATNGLTKTVADRSTKTPFSYDRSAALRSNECHLSRTEPDAVHDLICVGFGPASLAIAVALHDTIQDRAISSIPKVLFLEKQPTFAWHAGMLLPGAKMQISFIKDLATLRNPRSHFTFLNYLQQHGRLVEFTNLGTFLPARAEYEDYLRWCASFFKDVVRYNCNTVAVSRHRDTVLSDGVRIFQVTSRDLITGKTTTYQAKNVILGLGGQPSLPRGLPDGHPRVVHSSQYAHLVPGILSNTAAPYKVAVVGAGQSAAEIFNNIQTLYPNSRTWLIMRTEFLKPSDDSPFVNSIFNPEFVDAVYPKPARYRQHLLADARATNYGVVRLELIETLYERMYDQRWKLGNDDTIWPHRIMGGRIVAATEDSGQSLRLTLQKVQDIPLAGDARFDSHERLSGDLEILDVDLVIAATGYARSAHVDMLRDLWPLLPVRKEETGNALSRNSDWEVRTKSTDPNGHSTTSKRVLEVARDYRVQFSPGTVASGSGIWLQGCCESTHGLSDTLLSILATRSGEIVDSIFKIGETANAAEDGGAVLA